ncbi:MAG: hypothetical protein IJJ77_05035 [Paludibacteraceae bacterium]|nr:hypothetical protein [Paludibacteraceae bacterium]
MHKKSKGIWLYIKHKSFGFDIKIIVYLWRSLTKVHLHGENGKRIYTYRKALLDALSLTGRNLAVLKRLSNIKATMTSMGM